MCLLGHISWKMYTLYTLVSWFIVLVVVASVTYSIFNPLTVKNFEMFALRCYKMLLYCKQHAACMICLFLLQYIFSCKHEERIQSINTTIRVDDGKEYTVYIRYVGLCLKAWQCCSSHYFMFLAVSVMYIAFLLQGEHNS